MTDVDVDLPSAAVEVSLGSDVVEVEVIGAAPGESTVDPAAIADAVDEYLTANPPEGGVSDHGDLTGLDDPADHPWAGTVGAEPVASSGTETGVPHTILALADGITRQLPPWSASQQGRAWHYMSAVGTLTITPGATPFTDAAASLTIPAGYEVHIEGDDMGFATRWVAGPIVPIGTKVATAASVTAEAATRAAADLALGSSGVDLGTAVADATSQPALVFRSDGGNEHDAAAWTTPAPGPFTAGLDLRAMIRPLRPTGWDGTTDFYAEIVSQTRDGLGALDNFEMAVLWSGGGFGRTAGKPYLFLEWTRSGNTSEQDVSIVADVGLVEGAWSVVRGSIDFGTTTAALWRGVAYAGDDVTSDKRQWRTVETLVHANADSVAADSNVDGEDGPEPGGPPNPWGFGYNFPGDIAWVEGYDGLDGTPLASPAATDGLPGAATVDDGQSNTWTAGPATDIVSPLPSVGTGLTESGGRWAAQFGSSSGTITEGDDVRLPVNPVGGTDDGKVVTFDGFDVVWALPSTGPTTLDGLSDVSVATPSTGDLVRWNGSAWVKYADSGYATSGHNHSGTYQPADSDLTALAGLSPADDDVLQRKSGAWTNRTLAQLVADLATLLLPREQRITAIIGWMASSGTWLRTAIATTIGGGVAEDTTTNANTAYIEFDVVVDVGTWTIEPIHSQFTSGGTIAVKIDGTEVGTFSCYGGSTVRNVVTSITGVTIAAGRHTLRIQKKAAGTGSGWGCQLHAVYMKRTGA